MGCFQMRTSRKNISISDLKKLIKYDPITGFLYWLPRTPDMFTDGKHTAAHTCAKWNSKMAGKRAFTALNEGRPHGRIWRKPYYAHRVAWALTYRYWPIEVDHKNHDPSDNRLTNLRACSHIQNLSNQSSTKGSSSKYLGVSWDKSRDKWAASISPKGKTIHLGRHATEMGAALAYDAAAKRYFGDFANPNI